MGALDLLQQLKSRVSADQDPERALVDAALHGDRRAFDRLAREYEPRLRGFITRRVGSDAVDDVLQETLLSGWMALPRFDRRSGFKAWLYGIAVHKCIDYVRRRGRLQVELPLDELSGGWQSPEALYAAAELRETVRQSLEQLSAPQREVLELYYYAELTLAEIATVLRRNLNTVKYQFYRAHVVVEQKMNAGAPPQVEAAPRKRGVSARP